MLKQTLIEIFERDLIKLKDEISAFKDEKNLWVISEDIKNSAGNLTLHLCGNLKTYIGSELGGSGYRRQRDKEFSDKNIPRDLLLQNINETIIVVVSSLKNLNEKGFSNIYPQNFMEKNVSITFFLIHLVAHLNYHLGQVNYLRRLIE